MAHEGMKQTVANRWLHSRSIIGDANVEAVAQTIDRYSYMSAAGFNSLTRIQQEVIETPAPSSGDQIVHCAVPDDSNPNRDLVELGMGCESIQWPDSQFAPRTCRSR